ncbi:hypothetical protein [Streptomyces sp. NPDC087294]|uniref:hypothetical protein n=1 Tax=Streptomyces sp. NPDC087294 TaxID=3365777 RepID=UPI0037F8FE87
MYSRGVTSAEALLALGRRHRVDLPITDLVSGLLHERLTLDEAVTALLRRPPKPER